MKRMVSDVPVFGLWADDMALRWREILDYALVFLARCSGAACSA